MIYGLMVTKNEADRYLRSALEDMSAYVDGLFVYDDRSEDDTVGVACKFASVSVRPSHFPSFMDSESQFRQNAQAEFNRVMSPSIGDWILTLDADEFLRSDQDVRSSLEALTTEGTCTFKVAEVFDSSYGEDYVRVDGFWKDIHANRFYAWHPDTEFPDSGLGCGSIPTYATLNMRRVSDPVIVHYGYARLEDRVKKYARYIGRSGHNKTHVDSILRAPKLVKL